MISAQIEGRAPYMTYPEPFGGPPKQPQEFLRPAPKPVQQIRFNGVPLNGTRPGTVPSSQRSPNQYSSPPSSTIASITQLKGDQQGDDLSTTYAAYSRFFSHSPSFTYHNSGPYASLYQPHFTPILRPTYVPPPLSPLEAALYIPNTPSPINSPATFLTPPSPSSTLTSNSESLQHNTFKNENKKPSVSFKVPTGKEGSLKHRILTRPGESSISTRAPLDLQKLPENLQATAEVARKRLNAANSPPRSPAKLKSSCVIQCSDFKKGSLIQLPNGSVKKVEDLRTEDFVNSVKDTPTLRLADSTVVRIEENPILGTVIVTLTFNQRRTQVDLETKIDQPFFIYGRGWASCTPDRTHQNYGFKTHLLQVGDILISLVPCTSNSLSASTSNSIITTTTTATNTVVTARQLPVLNNQQSPASMQPHQVVMDSPPLIENHYHNIVNNNQQMSMHEYQPGDDSQQRFLQPQPISPDSFNLKKRRWSHPICDETKQSFKRVKS